MKILAIDPGTHCGYALSPFESGVWDLSVKRHEGGGMRFVKLRKYLMEVCNGGKDYGNRLVDMVVYEEVRRHRGTDAAQVYGGIVAIISSYCEQKLIPYLGVPVGTIKKFATGKGNSNKEVMLAAAMAKWPEINIVDDNRADALFLWAWAKEEYDN